MTGRLILILLLVIYGIAGEARAQSATQTPSSLTEQLFERVNGSVCTIIAIDEEDNLLRRGSGFILRDSRLLVTNAHVLAGFEQAEVKCGEQSAKVEKITNYDWEVDLVLAETGELDVEGLEISTRSEIKPGTQVYVFGSPFGLEGTISPGLASGQREIHGQTYIQISAPISAGSSGGPVTDDRGSVIAVTVAALELAQNINFALPASVLRKLPNVEMQLADLQLRGQQAQPSERAEAPALPERPAASGTAEFRGNPFGSGCGEIAISEYERKPVMATSKGLIRFKKRYSGELELDVSLFGVPATVFYRCDDQFGMVEGYYKISGHRDTVVEISDVLNTKYGMGSSNPIAEEEATKLGCLWNFSLTGSRSYRPSKRTTWNIDDQLRIDMIMCGGTSKLTFLFYGDPLLIKAVKRAEVLTSLDDL
jgi:hypothetical protein